MLIRSAAANNIMSACDAARNSEVGQVEAYAVRVERRESKMATKRMTKFPNQPGGRPKGKTVTKPTTLTRPGGVVNPGTLIAGLTMGQVANAAKGARQKGGQLHMGTLAKNLKKAQKR